MEKTEMVSNEILEKLIQKAEEKYEIVMENIVKSSKIDGKSAFLIGFCASSILSAASDDTIKTLSLIWELLSENSKTKPESASMKNMMRKIQLQKIQNEEEKHFCEEKKEKNQELLDILKPRKKPKINVDRPIESCKICLENMFSAPIHLMEGCPHVFHQECLREYLTCEVFICFYRTRKLSKR